MVDVMKELREEHRNIARILSALERQLEIFERGERPDYDVLSAIAAYFTGFPDRCHHPKEDVVYARMREKAPDTAQAIPDLDREHEKIGDLARRFEEAVTNVLAEAEIPRSAFSEVARHFVAEQRRHMEMEEERFFPRAEAALGPGDWADIDTRVESETDSLFDGKAGATFAALRDDILRWEEEDESRQT